MLRDDDVYWDVTKSIDTAVLVTEWGVVRGVTVMNGLGKGMAGREGKWRSVCNRGIAKTRTDVRVDWGSQFERRVTRVTVRELTG
jgi:hypothetical protein